MDVAPSPLGGGAPVCAPSDLAVADFLDSAARVVEVALDGVDVIASGGLEGQLDFGLAKAMREKVRSWPM